MNTYYQTDPTIQCIDDEIERRETHAFSEFTKKYFKQIKEKLNYTGSLQTFEIHYDGIYEIEANGAAGSGGNIYGTSYTSQGGHGAKIVANFAFKQGDVIDIVVGGMGTSKQATAKDGASGGGGGEHLFSNELNQLQMNDTSLQKVTSSMKHFLLPLEDLVVKTVVTKAITVVVMMDKHRITNHSTISQNIQKLQTTANQVLMLV